MPHKFVPQFIRLIVFFLIIVFNPHITLFLNLFIAQIVPMVQGKRFDNYKKYEDCVWSISNRKILAVYLKMALCRHQLFGFTRFVETRQPQIGLSSFHGDLSVILWHPGFSHSLDGVLHTPFWSRWVAKLPSGAISCCACPRHRDSSPVPGKCTSICPASAWRGERPSILTDIHGWPHRWACKR